MNISTRLSAVIVLAVAGVGTATATGAKAYRVLVPSALRQCPAGAPVAFVDVDVLTMLDSVPLRRQNVLVQGGRVTSVGNTPLPRDVCRIEAAGQVLLPGLADMHVHTDESEMPLFLSNGITLVREMNGSPRHVQLRERLARGEVVGPRLLVASPLLTGKPLRFRHRLVTSAEDAFAAAHEAKNAGFEYLKIYDDLSAADYDAFVQAARTVGLPLDGHVPNAVGLARVIAAGQAIQHMDKIAFAIAGHSGDTSALSAAAQLFTGKRIWITPTLASLRALDIAGTAEYASRIRQPEMAYVDSASVSWWRSLIGSGTRAYAPSPFYRLQTKLLPVLRKADARFLLGTDAANPLMIAGFSVHEELATLIRDGGFSPYAALLSATRNVGEFLNDSTVGVIRPGARADLILVADNPLMKPGALREPLGVMVGGRWLSRSQLQIGLKAAGTGSRPQ